MHIDSSRLLLAGDSAAAQIAAQLANIASEPSHAPLGSIEPTIQRSQLRGALLFCGAYDIERVNFSGVSGDFLKTVRWSHAGRKDFAPNPAFEPESVLRYVTPSFPSTLISLGNGDPLAPQSHAMSQALRQQKVHVDSLFFAPERRPALVYEYIWTTRPASMRWNARRASWRATNEAVKYPSQPVIRHR